MMAQHHNQGSAHTNCNTQSRETYQSRIQRIDHLTRVLQTCCVRYQNPELLDAVEQLARDGVNIALLKNSGDLCEYRANLGLILMDKYHRTGSLSVLSEVITLFWTSLRAMKFGHYMRIKILIALARAIFERFLCDMDKHSDDIKAAVTLLEEVLRPTSSADQMQMAVALSTLGLIKSNGLVRMAHPLTLDDLDTLERKLRSIAPEVARPAQLPVYYLAFGSICFAYLNFAQDLHWADEGIQWYNTLICTQSIPRHERLQARFNLTRLLLLRGCLTMSPSDHRDAMDSSEAALRETANVQSSPHDRAYALYDSARSKIHSSNEVGDVATLEDAVETLKGALDMCPSPHYTRSLIVSTLIVGLGQYFEHSGHISALDEILSLRHFSPEMIRTSPFFATNLAEPMILRSRTTTPTVAQSLLHEAVGIVQTRLDYYLSHPSNSQGWERTEINLTLVRAALEMEEAGTPMPSMTLDVMVCMAREAVQHSIRALGPTANLTLCQLLLRKALEQHDVDTLSEADAILSELYGAETTSKHFRADVTTLQASALTTRSIISGSNMSILDAAWRKYEEAIKESASPPRYRFFAALKWARSALDQRMPLIALRAYSHAIELLPRLIFLGHQIAEQVEVLREVRNFAAGAGAVALSLNQFDLALEMLEQTRGIYWMRALQMRPSLDKLPIGVRATCEDILSTLNQDRGLNVLQRREKADQLDVILHHIRSMGGLERFLLPPTPASIKMLARDMGVVVVVIVPVETGSHVMMLDGSDESQYIFLPDLTTARLNHLVRHLQNLQCEVSNQVYGARKVHLASHAPKSSYSDGITSILSELWNALGLPLVRALKLKPIMNCFDTRKRIVWCPVGPLNLLPLHAAGVYETSPTGPSDHLSNYVVSSYTPTLTALHRAWFTDKERTPVNRPYPCVLAVAQPEVSAFNSLPMAREEVDTVKQLLSADHGIRALNISSSLSVASALEHLPNVEVLHLACHGQQDPNNPLNSGFELEDGRLTLSQLMKVNIPNAQLAYLSACETASTDETRPDESINLAAAMLFIGFKSVIATMWAMDDVDGPFIAKRVYSAIFKDGHLDLGVVPWALDNAVRELRESGVPATRWATYIHLGV